MIIRRTVGTLYRACNPVAIPQDAQTIFVEDESSAVMKGYSPILRSALYSGYSMHHAKNLLPCNSEQNVMHCSLGALVCFHRVAGKRKCSRYQEGSYS